MTWEHPQIPSSYEDETIGKTLYELILKNKSKKIVEFGSFGGWTAVCMAMALRDSGGEGTITSYDIGNQIISVPLTKKSEHIGLYSEIDRLGVEKYINFEIADYYQWMEQPLKGDEFDFLYVDVGNTQQTIKLSRQKCQSHIDNGAVVCFEGGGVYRDAFVGRANSGYWLDNHDIAELNPVREEVRFITLFEFDNIITDSLSVLDRE